jgi:hypothetical protein
MNRLYFSSASSMFVFNCCSFPHDLPFITYGVLSFLDGR